MSEKQVQIKKSTFTKIFYTVMKIINDAEQNIIVLDEEILKNLIEIQDDFSNKVMAMQEREEYTNNLLNKNKE